MDKRIASILLALALVTLTSRAQTGGAGGRVTAADDGSPVVGATVMVKGTQTGTVTDHDGRFTIAKLPHQGKTLVISYVGMQTVDVAAKQGLNVVMEPATKTVDEVIVVAFGKQKRESFTGSAGTLDAKALQERQVTNPLAALNGRVAGVQMVEGNTETSQPEINVRGVSSVNAGTTPLVVLDGLPYPGYYTDINPADVESITVLKDAASTALYGARGANGVILITTKAAKRGQARISFDAKIGSSHNARVDYECLDEPGEYYEMYYKAHYNYQRATGHSRWDSHVAANNALCGSSADGGLGFVTWQAPDGQYLIGENGRMNPQATPGVISSNNGKDYLLIPDDWKKQALRDGLRQEYNVNVNGGTDAFQSYVSLGYVNSEGICYGTDYERFTGRAKMDWQARKWLRMGINTSYTHTDSNSSGQALTPVHEMAKIYPLYIRDAQGNILQDARGPMYDYGTGAITGATRVWEYNSNPLQSDLLDIYNENSNAFSGQLYAELTFGDFRLTSNVSIYDLETRSNSGDNPYYSFGTSYGGSLSTAHNRYYTFNTQQLLNYNHSFGHHNVAALLGHEYTRDDTKKLSASKTKYFSFDTHRELNALLVNGTASGSDSVYNIEGWFLRAQYDYDGRYFASASFRRDGSSRFHPDHRWGNFWSVGGAWILTKESWQLPAWVSMLKLKASFGQQGNDAIGNFYYTDYYDIQAIKGEGSLNFSSKGNPEITWETNTNLNIGVEFELFNHRLRGSVEFYNRKTSDMLMWFTAPQSLGYSGYYDNVGDMRNRGFEFSLDGDVVKTRHITWNLYANASMNRNKVTYLPDENKTTLIDGSAGYYYGKWQFVGEGRPIYTFEIPKYAGVDAQGKSLWYVRDEATGELSTTDNFGEASYFLSGDANPKVFGGFGTTLSAYGFDLSANFNYSLGGKAIDAGYEHFMQCPASGYVGQRIHKDMLGAWSADNPESTIPRWQYGDLYSNSMSDRWLVSASYLAIKNIQLGYTFPKTLLRTLGLTQLRVYVACDNVAYFTARKGFDPRGSLRGVTDYEVDWHPTRMISGGLSVQF